MRPSRAGHRAVSVSRKPAAVGPAIAWVALFLIVSQFVPSASSQSAGASSGLTPTEASALHLNERLFEATVPNVVYLGENFSVSIQLTNTSNESIPAIVELSTPIDTLYVSPLIHRENIAPGAQVTEVFWVVAIQTADLSKDVTVKVWVWFQQRMAAPELVIQSTTKVFSVQSSPLAPYVMIAIGVIVASAVLIAAALLRRSSRRRRQERPPNG